MDAQAQKKALFHAKLKEASQKLEKCIDSPLVRYIEYDRPVCRVCDVILKSKSLWAAHQASRKHHEAINNLKSSVTKQNFVEDVKSGPAPEVIPKSWPAPLLPAHFLDNNETKKQKGGSDVGSKIDPAFPQISVPVDLVNSHSTFYTGKKDGAPAVSHSSGLSGPVIKRDVLETVERKESKTSGQLNQPSTKMDVSEAKQVKGALPEGFFDNKDADLRARGIEPVKVDIRDEYKGFEKAIQEDLQEVDERLQEEEIDAA